MLASAGALTVAVIGAGVVMAQTPGATPGGSAQSFLDRVAQKLGIDTPKLQDAIKSARTDQIDEAVANGDLTQKQADALKQKLQNSPNGGAFPFFDGHGKRGGPFGAGPGGPFGFGPGPGLGLEDAGQKLADFLGISTDQLHTELSADNATLATVAAAHGKSRDGLKSFITDGAKSKLDKAVADGNLTQKNADAALAMLAAHLDALIDSGKFHIGRGRFEFKFHTGHADDGDEDDNGTPGATPSTPSQSGTSRSIFSS